MFWDTCAKVAFLEAWGLATHDTSQLVNLGTRRTIHNVSLLI